MSDSQPDVPAINLPAQPVPKVPARPGTSVILKRFDFGRVHGTLWQRQNASGHMNLDLSIFRKYVDSQGLWRESHSFSVQDLPCVRIIINRALRFLKMEQGVNAPQSTESRRTSAAQASQVAPIAPHQP